MNQTERSAKWAFWDLYKAQNALANINEHGKRMDPNVSGNVKRALKLIEIAHLLLEQAFEDLK